MLNWLARLFGPMFAKEMVELARRPRYVLARVLLGLAVLCGLAVVWSESRFSTTALGIHEQAILASELMRTVALVQYGAVYLFVPVFVCGLVAGEREAQTLELLFTTHLSDREIVLGKLASRLALVAVLSMSLVPVLGLLGLMGGIDLAHVARLAASTLMAVLFTGGHAIYFSSSVRTPTAALVYTYASLAIELVILPVVLLLASELIPVPAWSAAAQNAIAAGLVFVHPVAQFAIQWDESQFSVNPMAFRPWVLPATYVFPLAAAAVLHLAAVRRLRRLPPARDWLVRVGSALVTSARRVRKSLSWTPPQDPQAAPQGRIVGAGPPHGAVEENPLRWRARVARTLDRGGYYRRIAWTGGLLLGGLLLLIGVADPDSLDEEQVLIPIVAFTWIAIWLLAAVVSAGAIVGDRRRGFLDELLATPLDAREIVDGTLLAIWDHMKRLALIPLGLTVLFVFTRGSHPVLAFFSPITGTICGTTLVFLAVLCSMSARHVAISLAPVLVFAGLMNVGIVVSAVFFDRAAGPVTWLAVAVLLPFSWHRARQSRSPAVLAVFFASSHLAIVLFATCWTASESGDQYPLCAVHPGYITAASMALRPRDPFRHDAWGFWIPVCFWTAQIVHLVWMRWFMIAHFDRLTDRGAWQGRPDGQAQRLANRSTMPEPRTEEEPVTAEVE